MAAVCSTRGHRTVPAGSRTVTRQTLLRGMMRRPPGSRKASAVAVTPLISPLRISSAFRVSATFVPGLSVSTVAQSVEMIRGGP